MHVMNSLYRKKLLKKFNKKKSIKDANKALFYSKKSSLKVFHNPKIRYHIHFLVILKNIKSITKKKKKIKIKSMIVLVFFQKTGDSLFSLGGRARRKIIVYNRKTKSYDLAQQISDIINILNTTTVKKSSKIFLNITFTTLTQYVFFIKNNILSNLLLNFKIYLSADQILLDLDRRKNTTKKTYFFTDIKLKFILCQVNIFFSMQNSDVFDRCASIHKNIVLSPKDYELVSKVLFELKYVNYLAKGTLPNPKELQMKKIESVKFLYGRHTITKFLFRNPKQQIESNIATTVAAAKSFDLNHAYSWALDKDVFLGQVVTNFRPSVNTPHYSLIQHSGLKQLLKIFVTEHLKEKLLFFLDRLADLFFPTICSENTNGLIMLVLVPINALVELTSMGCVILEIYHVELYVQDTNKKAISNFRDGYSAYNYRFLLKNLDYDLKDSVQEIEVLLKFYLNLSYGLNFRNMFTNHMAKLKRNYMKKNVGPSYVINEENTVWSLNGNFFFPRVLNLWSDKKKDITFLVSISEILSRHEVMFTTKTFNDKKVPGYLVTWQMLFKNDRQQINYLRLYVALNQCFLYLSIKFNSKIQKKLETNELFSKSDSIALQARWDYFLKNIYKGFYFPDWSPNFDNSVKLLEENALSVAILSNQITKSGNFLHGNSIIDNVTCIFDNTKTYFFDKHSILKEILLSQAQQSKSKALSDGDLEELPGIFRSSDLLLSTTNNLGLVEEWRMSQKNTLVRSYNGRPLLPISSGEKLDKVNISKGKSIIKLYWKIKKNEIDFIEGNFILTEKEERLISAIRALKLISEISLFKKK